MTEPKIQTLPNGWKLISYGNEQISVGPDALIYFDRHASPDQIPDYIGAQQTAAEIATQIRDSNTAKAALNLEQPAALPTTQAIVTAGPPPPGAIPLTPQATIGRQKNRQRGNR